jgi:diphosphomevalonate decarboxylase
MNLDGLETRTSVHFDQSLPADRLKINGRRAGESARLRVSRMLDEVRVQAGFARYAWVESQNNFPTGAGIASSASAFAALVLAATHAAGLNLDEVSLSRLARHGSGSACRSIPGGFVEWFAGTGDADSFATSIAPAGYWDLADCIAVVSSGPKITGSTEGHALAGTSPLQAARVEDASRRLEICRNALLNRDFTSLAEIVEQDSNLMHAVMMTSAPPIFYWQPASLSVIQAVRSARSRGLPVCYTIDAGPNVHVICTGTVVEEVARLVGGLPGVQQVLQAKVGGPARLLE